MFWADKIAKEIVESGKYKPYRVDDMKTPSGKVHVGSLRGVVIHDLIYKVLKERGQEATYTYCINDMDPMDGFPPYLNRDKFYKYMGWPLFRIPSPGKEAEYFSQYYANEFIKVFNSIDCHPKIIWTSNLYKEGKFDDVIRICLDKTEQIREIFKKQYERFKAETYFPYLPICPQCSKIATTKVYKWDGEYVYFHCQEDAVDYTKGCGFKGKVKPEKQNGKMPWKIEWAVHWKVLGVTIEWAGKDHMTEGGSYEISSQVCRDILDYPPPHAFLYEHLLVGGRKMSSSKGKGASAAEVARILPPEILRFLLVRTHFKKTIDFNPEGMTIPDLFDECDSFADVFYTKNKESDFGRIWQLSQVGTIAKEKPFLSRFRNIANYVQNPSVDIYKKNEEIKGTRLTKEEKDILDERIKYAKIWLDSYAPEEFIYQVSEKISEKVTDFSEEQKDYLQKVSDLLSQKDWQPESLQQELYEVAKKLEIPTKKAFQAIYLSLIGKTHGPKAAWFILSQDLKFVKKRFKKAVNL